MIQYNPASIVVFRLRGTCGLSQGMAEHFRPDPGAVVTCRVLTSGIPDVSQLRPLSSNKDQGGGMDGPLERAELALQ